MSELAHRPTLAGQVSQIDVSDVRNAVVMLKTTPRCCGLETSVSRSACSPISI